MLRGKAWKYGDDVDTDVIIPARYLTSADPDVLKAHCLEDLDADFAAKVGQGDILVAGANFGCGSSREHAPLSIKAAGVSLVIAKSFARIFFRNAFNIGLPIMESDKTEEIDAGDELEVDLSTGLIRDLTKNSEFQARPVPEFMRELVSMGGLIPFARKRMAENKTPVKGKAPEQEKEEVTPPEPGQRMRELEAETDKGKAAPWIEEEESAKISQEEALEAGEMEEDEE